MDKLISLELHESVTGFSAKLRPVVDRALTVMAELLSAGIDSGQRRPALAEIERCRTAISEERDPARIQSAAIAAFDACQHAVSEMTSQRMARQVEMTSLISLVREAVSAMTGDHDKLDIHLNQSAQRFEELALCDDLRRLKERLASEVVVLKRVAVERRRSWESTVSVFEQKVATLERQLIDTKREASLDPLTRIANRRTFDRVCQTWIEAGKGPFVLALVDLDDFKSINDTRGHSVGDRVLLQVAQALKAAVRSVDLVARFGGDEFAVLATGVTLAQAQQRMNAVAATLARATVLPGEVLPITLSCGIAAFAEGDTVDALMRRADQALYDAKRAGKNRVSLQDVPAA
jgi:diguanylate cyclase